MLERNTGDDNPTHSEERYNGWKNYQTWCVKVWLDSNEELLWRFERLAREETAEQDVTDAFYGYFEANNPLENVPSPYNDLLTHALQQVAWTEIVQSLRSEP